MKLEPPAFPAGRPGLATPAPGPMATTAFASLVSDPTSDAEMEAAPFSAYGVFGRPAAGDPLSVPSRRGAAGAGAGAGAADPLVLDSVESVPAVAPSAVIVGRPPATDCTASFPKPARIAPLRSPSPSRQPPLASPGESVDHPGTDPADLGEVTAASNRAPVRPKRATGQGPQLSVAEEAGRPSEVRLGGLDLSDEEVRRFRDQARRLLHEHGGGLHKLVINGEDAGTDGPDRRFPWR